VPRFTLLIALSAAAGCALGPRGIDRNRLRYNEAVKVTTDQQLLLNIVRLRYTDTPSSLAVTSIADQKEIISGLRAVPFFAAAGAGNIGSFRGSVLPQIELTAADRPTVSYTPLDDQEFTRRLFTPISLDGVAYLAKTTWPIATVFRLWLENVNWVSNAQTASGPTPATPPNFAAFRVGIDALQRLQERNLVVIVNTERDEKLTDPVAASAATPTAAVEAAKAGFEYRKADGGWEVVRKKTQPVLRVGAVPAGDPDWAAVATTFHLAPARRTFDLTADKLDPFLADAPAAGLDRLDLETRSLLQVLFFMSHGVEVPAEHLACGIAPSTAGGAFDWRQVTDKLFRVTACRGRHPPADAHVSVYYEGYWFSIDGRDRETKATFALLVELSRLELGTKAGAAPILTLPLGGR